MAVTVRRRRLKYSLTDARLTVARLLAGREPIPGAEAAAALGWPLGKWWTVVSGSNWFEVGGRGWVLTGAGRAEVRPGE